MTITSKMDQTKLDKLVSSIKHLKYNADIIYNLTCFFEDELIVWNDREQSLYFCALDQKCQICDINVVTLSKPPVFNITSLSLSPDGDYLALFGSNEVVVVELHPNLTHRFNSRKTTISIAKSKSIGERMFLCNKSFKLQCLRWHPTSKNHIFLLINDNCLRIFDVDEYEPIKSINLSSKLNCESHYQRVSLYSDSLGESSVSFDFGPSLSRFHNTVGAEEFSNIYPIFILNGNGDVLIIYISFSDLFIADKVYGPLKMTPAAEDNYGSDACSILCMDCVPPIIIIGTSSGLLYHCVAIENDPVDNDKTSNKHSPIDDSYTFNLSSGVDVVIPEITLFVLEAIELSFSLTFSSHDSDAYLSDTLNTSLQIFIDCKDPKRYYCLHSFGVHIVLVSFFKQLNQNFEQFYEDKSVVEYLICTKPSSKKIDSDIVKDSFPVGIALIQNRGFSYLTVLLNSANLISKRLANVLISNDSENLLIKKSQADLQSSLSSLGLANSDILTNTNKYVFSEYIEKVLEKSTSLPLIKSARPKDDKVGAPDLEMLLNSIDVLKKEYIDKYSLAAKAIEKRKNYLKNDCIQQIEEINNVKKEKDTILQKYSKLVDKYDGVKEFQRKLSLRLEKIITEIQNQRPTLSDAELKIKEDLDKQQKNVDAYKQKLEQIKQKHLYQTQIRKSLQNDDEIGLQELSSSLQIANIKKVLASQNEQISEIMALLNSSGINS